MRKRRFQQQMAIFLAINLLFQTIFSVPLMALTGGPSQPEMAGFQPIGTSNMVDLFTGDFSYNIPLMDVDGYPINIAYNSNPTMDQEASWVGLGWSLNPGTVNRELRGFPDDFKNEPIEREYNIRDDVTIGLSAGPSLEFAGLLEVGVGMGIFYNTYRGIGREVGLSLGVLLGDKTSGNIGLDINSNTQSGIDVDLSAGLGRQIGLFSKIKSLGFNASLGFNSRAGLKDLALRGNIGVNARLGKRLTVLNPSFGSNYSFGDFTYFPTSPLPLDNESFTFNGTLGTEGLGFHPSSRVKGYGIRQYLLENSATQSAYGYLYHQEGQNDLNSLQDFNRGHDIPYREDMPTLSTVYGTYDLFNVSGQGAGGQFRTSRADIGVFRNPYAANTSTSQTVGIEAGLGAYFHGGGNINIITATNRSGLWEENNELREHLPFTADDGIYQASIVKASGETTNIDESFFQDISETFPIAGVTEKKGLKTLLKAQFRKEGGLPQTASISNSIRQTTRTKRNQLFQYLTASEAETGALNPTINSYPTTHPAWFDNLLDYACPYTLDPIARVDGEERKEHHISEVTLTQANGSRYVYGIPAYNTKQKEVNFSIQRDDNTMTENDELVEYAAGSDNSIDNENGRENYFDAQTIPAYAHSFLLTGVLSPDYNDKKGDGITPDDPGNAIIPTPL